jgi:hypothetical protein
MTPLVMPLLNIMLSTMEPFVALVVRVINLKVTFLGANDRPGNHLLSYNQIGVSIRLHPRTTLYIAVALVY